MQQFGVDIRQFDQRDRRDETEHFLKGVDQTVAADREDGADSEVEVHPRIDCSYIAHLCKRDSGISHRLRHEDPHGRLYQLCTACHVGQRGDSHHADHDLDEEELHGGRHDDRGDQDGCKVEIEGGS